MALTRLLACLVYERMPQLPKDDHRQNANTTALRPTGRRFQCRSLASGAELLYQYLKGIYKGRR